MIMWMNEALNEKVYGLTRQALHADSEDELSRALCALEEIVETTGYPLPIQKMFLLWESKRISIERFIIFLDDCRRWAAELPDAKALELLDEALRWGTQALWRVTRPTR